VDEETIAALRGARGARAIGLAQAQRGTAVEGIRVAVVAGLGALAHAVPAHGIGAHARLACAFLAELDLAPVAATIAVLQVAVVALLTRRHERVATASDRTARLAGDGTGVARVDGEAV